MTYVILSIAIAWAVALHRMQPKHGARWWDYGGWDFYVFLWKPVWWRSGEWITKQEWHCRG
jgi:hypothetical protein